jgi:release factor glutamine methyltransferase
MPEVSAIGNLIAQATNRLGKGGIPEPRREALRIWGDLSGNPLSPVLSDGVPADAAAVDRFTEAIERRARGEPLPYVTGMVGFRHLSLRSDRRGLIPRPETEGLVDLLLQRLVSGCIADIGTGTGCLALSLATEGSFNLVVGVDRSPEAIALARENADAVGSGATVHFIQGDLCGPLRGGTFDALISNPPYLTHEEHAVLEPGVRDWEPALALVGGVDGLDLTRRLLGQALDVVRPGGWIALEIDSSRATVTAELATLRGWRNVSIHEDLFGRERYLLAQRSETR